MDGGLKKTGTNSGTKKKKSSKKLSSPRTKKNGAKDGKKKAPRKMKPTKSNETSDDDDDIFQIVSTAAAANKSSAPTPTPSLPVHELPDPDDLLKSMQKEMRSLKLEAKRLFDEMEDAKKGNDEEILQVKRDTQIEKFKGNELARIDQLLRLGFDPQVMKEHLQTTNKELRKEVDKKQKDVNNISANVQKMTSANKESEKAVSAAHGAYGPLVVQQQTLQAKLEQAEVELYAIETKVQHRKNMKSVEIMSKDKFKDAIGEIMRKMKIRCRDQELLNDVLRKAEKKLDRELSLSPVERAKNTPKKKRPSMKKKKPAATSPTKVTSLPVTKQKSVPRSKGAASDDSIDSISVSISSSSSSSSGLSSVEVSSVES